MKWTLTRAIGYSPARPCRSSLPKSSTALPRPRRADDRAARPARRRRPALRARGVPLERCPGRADRSGARHSVGACWRRARRSTIARPHSRSRISATCIREGLLGDLHPEGGGRSRRRLPDLCLAAAELGRYCGATALSWNMHVCSTLWSGPLADDLTWTPADARRAQRPPRRAITSASSTTARSMRSRSRKAARRRPAASRSAPRREPVEGGFIVNGKKIFASLSGAADYYGVLCTERAEGENGDRAATRSISRFRPMPTASPSSATGIRSACAARSRARCCSRTCSCPRRRC